MSDGLDISLAQEWGAKMNPLSINPIHLLIACAVAAIFGFGGGWTTNGWRLNAEISDIKAMRSKEVATQATATVTTMKEDAKAIHEATEEFVAIQNTLGPKLDSLKKELKNAKSSTTFSVVFCYAIRRWGN